MPLPSSIPKCRTNMSIPCTDLFPGQQNKMEKIITRPIDYFISCELQTNSELQGTRFHPLLTNEESVLTTYNETSFAVHTLISFMILHFTRKNN